MNTVTIDEYAKNIFFYHKLSDSFQNISIKLLKRWSTTNNRQSPTDDGHTDSF